MYGRLKGLLGNWFTSERLRARLSRVERPEIEQATLRVAIVGLVLVYLIFAANMDGRIDRHELEVVWVAIGTVAFGLALMFRIIAAGGASVTRRLLGMLADNAVTTYCMIQMEEAGAIIIGVYLFVTFGNGFRYGRVYLHASQALSIAGFCTVVALSEYWRSNLTLSLGLLLASIVLPFYVGVLAQRITEARRKADEANQAKGRFLANMSHEMRTPLNGVIAMADVLRDLQTRRWPMWRRRPTGATSLRPVRRSRSFNGSRKRDVASTPGQARLCRRHLARLCTGVRPRLLSEPGGGESGRTQRLHR